MLRFALIALALGLALPAEAQPLDQIHRLVEQLQARNRAPAAAMAAEVVEGTEGAERRGSMAPRTAPVLGLVGSSVAEDVSAPAVTAGWNPFSMAVCIAGVVGSEQFVAAITTTSAVVVTQSNYATPVIAANCASGRTFWVYLERDLTTVSAIASYPR